MFSLQLGVLIVGFVCLGFDHAKGNRKCLQPFSPGSCSGSNTFFTFNQDTKQCEPKTFSSCPGNKNYFRFEAVCKRTCAVFMGDGAMPIPQNRPQRPGAVGPQRPGAVGPQRPGAVGPQRAGPVPASNPAPRPPAPRPQGNKVPVFTVNVNPNGNTRPARCNEALTSGTCGGRFTKYYYNKDFKQCMSFTYSGCGGTQNRFNDLQSCIDTCNPVYKVQA